MKFLATLTTVAVAAGSALAQFTINTPTNAVVCQPLLIAWSGGTAPYFLSILPGNEPSATALENLGQVSGTSLTWTVNIAAGTSIGFTLTDSTGATAQSAAFTINAGSDSSCVGKTSSTSAAASTAGNTTPASSGAATSSAPTTSAAVTTSVSSTAPAATNTASSASKAATTSGSSTSTSAQATSSNAAPTQAAGFGAALLGAAAVAFLA